MDTVLVLAMVNWIMAELVRVLHATTTQQAQAAVDALASRRLPLIWEDGKTRRVLDTSLSLQDQMLLLVGSLPSGANPDDVFKNTGSSDRAYFNKLLRKMHKARMVDLSADESRVVVLPPGSSRLEELVLSHMRKKNARS